MFASLVVGCLSCQARWAGQGRQHASAGSTAATPEGSRGEQRLNFKLDNGLQVILEENHAAPVVAMQAWVKAGAADEPAHLAGVSHFLEHMLFKGTARRGVGEIARTIESAGGEINAWTSYDETVFHLVIAEKFLATGLDVLSDALAHSSFDAAELERERQVILEEVKQGQDDPDRMVAQTMFEESFAGHSYGRPVIGSTETVTRMSRGEIADYHRTHYHGGNITLVVVGDFDAQTVRQQVTRAFSVLPPDGAASARTPLTAPAPGRVRVLVRDVKESQILFGFRSPSINHEDVPALDLLAVVLGQGESSRLHVEIVRNQQLAKSAYGYVFSARDAGLLMVSATPGGARVRDTARAVLDEVLALARTEVTPQELDKARNILESERVFERETVQGYARKLGYFSAIAGDQDFETRYMARLARLTTADLKAVAERVLRPEGLAVVVQIPQDSPQARNPAGSDVAAPPGAGLAATLTEIVASAADRAEKRARKIARGAAASTRNARNAATGADRKAPAVVRHVFDSGLTVLVLRDTSVPIISVRALWPGGLRYEDLRSNGASNLIASLLSRGTRSRKATEIASEVETLAGSLSGFAGRNSVGMHAEFLARHADRGLALLADCLQNSTFDESELEKERRIVLDDIAAQGDDLGHSVFRLFHAALWKRHPYRLDVMGRADSVSGLTRRRLQIHFRTHYRIDNLVLAVVGDVDPDAILNKIGQLFPGAGARGERAGAPPEIAREAPPSAAQQVFEFREREQAHLVLGFPGTTLADRDRFGLELLSQILSGQGGRLFAELREKRGLVYRVSAFSLEGLDPGYFAIYLAASPAKLPEAIAATRTEIEHILRDGVTGEELERAKRYLIGVHAIGLQRRSSLAATLAFHEAYGQGWGEYRRYPERIAAVTPADLARLARKYLDASREVMAIVAPEQSTPALGRAAVSASAPGAAAARSAGLRSGPARE